MRKYKNPVMYARVLYEQNKKKSRRLTKEQKEMRRKYRETLKNKKKAQLTKDNESKKAGN
jgi:flagellar basal body-associated protein FliL